VFVHKFYADFIVFDKIILEINDKSIAQSINDLMVSKCKLSLLVNFGELQLNYKRIMKQHESRPDNYRDKIRYSWTF
jgi:GxxExxY protein